MLHPQTMKPRNQPRPALIDDGELPFDPRPDMACRARQPLGDPGSRPLPLLGAQMTAAALVAEPGQPLDPVFPVEPEPRANRIVVEQKYRPDLRATHPPIQQHERIAAPRQMMLDQAVASQLDQLRPFRRAQKSSANHAPSKNPSRRNWQALFRLPSESRYIYLRLHHDQLASADCLTGLGLRRTDGEGGSYPIERGGRVNDWRHLKAETPSLARQVHAASPAPASPLRSQGNEVSENSPVIAGTMAAGSWPGDPGIAIGKEAASP